MGAPTKREQALIQGIAMGQSPEVIARNVGCTTALVHRRMTNAEFMARVRRERSRMSTETGSWLLAWSKHCGRYLFDVVSDSSQTPTIRVRAAQVLLAEARSWIEADVMERLVELEEAAGMRVDG